MMNSNTPGLPTRIDSFTGDWAFLSNFYCPAVVELDGIKYMSVEHAYQAAKVLDPATREILTLDFNPRLTAAKAKSTGRSFDRRKLTRPDWKQVNIGIMRDLLVQKFTPTILRRKLIATFSTELIEGNWWHDTFWGVCYGGLREGFHGSTCREWLHDPSGKNHLGILLMEIRRLVAQPLFNAPLQGIASDLNTANLK